MTSLNLQLPAPLVPSALDSCQWYSRALTTTAVAGSQAVAVEKGDCSPSWRPGSLWGMLYPDDVTNCGEIRYNITSSLRACQVSELAHNQVLVHPTHLSHCPLVKELLRR